MPGLSDRLNCGMDPKLDPGAQKPRGTLLAVMGEGGMIAPLPIAPLEKPWSMIAAKVNMSSCPILAIT